MTNSGAIQREPGDLPVGTQIGRYRIEDPVGRGGMGTVYRAYDDSTNRNVALKLLAEGIPATLRERFLAECEAEANIRHEHVMPVYDRGWLTDERPYFVMELLYQPITLTDLLDAIHRGTIGSTHPRVRHWTDLGRLIADVLLPICEGVAVANVEYGIQHRDLKPDNVLIDVRTKRAYLIDFGICRTMDDHSDAGKIVGTPRFLSPEQASARTDRRTDVWALGALLRYAVTGEPPLLGTSPFTRAEVRERVAALQAAEAKATAAGEDAKARGYAKRREQLEDPTLRVQEDLIRDARDGIYLAMPETVSPGLGAIIQKAMAPRSEERYADARGLVADLRAWLHGGSVSALSEQGRSGAAVDWARRLLNRNVVRAGGTLIALAFGWVLGKGLFQQVPPAPDFRAEDARADLRTYEARVAALPSRATPASVLPRAESALRWMLLRDRAALQRRLQEAFTSGGESQEETPEVGIPSPSSLEIEGWRGGGWQVEDLVRHTRAELEMKGPSVQLQPGAYAISSTAPPGLDLRVVVPGTPSHGFRRAGNKLGRLVSVGPHEGELPGDLTWVPAGPAAPDTDATSPAFLGGRDLVTNERYSEWLDDLPAAERPARVPPAGFRRSERDPGRWLVVQELATRPVVGVRPVDAQAYAAWRASVEGVDLRLPSAAEWQRMAAIDQSFEGGAGLIFPWRDAPWSRARARRGAAGRADGGADVSPNGIHGLLAGHGELVREEDGSFGVKARGGVVPLPSALLRTEALEPRAQGHAYGFRLVHVVP